MTQAAGALFIGSEIYRNSSYGGWHPLRIPRVSTAMDLSRAMGWLPAARYVTSPRAKPKALTLWHDPGYLEALVAAEAAQSVSPETRARHGLGTPSNPVFPEMFRRPATAAGASLWAGELLAQGGWVFSPGGGTHHGLPDRANGFCYLNDVMLAILALRRSGVRRIAYVDIDAHHPDGVQLGVAGDPDILLVSVHEENRWPRTGRVDEDGVGNLWNLPVPAGMNDSEMDLARQALIEPLVRSFAPDAVILQCGADAVAEDPQSRLALSNQTHFAFVRGLRSMAPRFLVLGGGGYNPWTVGRLWAGVWATLTDQPIPPSLPPQAEGVLRALSWSDARGARVPSEDLFTTLADTARPGPIGAEFQARLAHLCTRAGLKLG